MSERKTPRSQYQPDRESGSARRARIAADSDDDHDPQRVDRLVGFTHQQAAARIFSPARPQLARVIELAAHVDDPLELYERLIAHGIVSDRWLHAKRQVIERRCPRCQLSPPWFIGHDPACDELSRPQTVAALVALSADFAGVCAAEALAREAWVRLLPWCWRDEPLFLWQVLDPSAREPEYAFSRAQMGHSVKPVAMEAAAMIVARAARRDRLSTDSTEQDWATERDAWLTRFKLDAAAHWSWALSDRRRANPFTPLCELWMLGYCLVEMREETLIMMAPALEWPPSQ